jgi:hypothetical protein
VAIPAGKTMTLWSDGTSFAQQNTHLISPTLATPTITGVSAAPTATFGTNTTQLATTAFVQAALQALYPVGCVYTSTVATNPGTIFGFGTWVAFAAGRVMIGDGGGFTAGSTGGSADAIVVSHTHTASSSFSGSALGNHTHTATDSGHYHSVPSGAYTGSQPGYVGGSSVNYQGSTSTGTSYANITVASASAGTPSGSVSTSVTATGSAATNANLQPYVVVYVWNRTA